KYIAWYYTPMAVPFTHDIPAAELTVYDCMDELSAFKNPPPGIHWNERRLLEMADIVFTGGHSLYEAKKGLHDCMIPFPSSIDKEHFAKARTTKVDPDDQKDIPHPRIGFFGVIDERFDIGLIDHAATIRPEWHFIIIGPVVKIDPDTLPRQSNI